MSTTPQGQCILTLTPEERSVLLGLLEQAVSDTHLESRRTEAPEYRQWIHDAEAALKRLVEKVRQAGS